MKNRGDSYFFIPPKKTFNFNFLKIKGSKTVDTTVLQKDLINTIKTVNKMNIFISIFKTTPVYLTVSICALYCGVFCVNSHAEQSPNQTNAIVIEVTGSEFNWHFRYPGKDGKLGTQDDHHSIQNLYLPNNSHITLKLTSTDYVYSFAVPELNKEEIAVPELSFEMQFKTGDAKTLTLLGDQLCGYIHPTLIGKVHIRSKNDTFYTGAG